MNKKLVYSVVISGVIRFLLTSSKFSKSIENRIEVSTPLNSWKRVQEGSHLYENSVDPYQGDVYHENPLTLIGSSFLIKNFNKYIPLIFIILDLAASLLIYSTAKNIVKKNVSYIYTVSNCYVFYFNIICSLRNKPKKLRATLKRRKRSSCKPVISWIFLSTVLSPISSIRSQY